MKVIFIDGSQLSGKSTLIKGLKKVQKINRRKNMENLDNQTQKLIPIFRKIDDECLGCPDNHEPFDECLFCRRTEGFVDWGEYLYENNVRLLTDDEVAFIDKIRALSLSKKIEDTRQKFLQEAIASFTESITTDEQYLKFLDELTTKEAIEIREIALAHTTDCGCKDFNKILGCCAREHFVVCDQLESYLKDSKSLYEHNCRLLTEGEIELLKTIKKIGGK